MKKIEAAQSTLVNDTCNDCGSYADIGAVIDEFDTELILSFEGAEAITQAEAAAQKAVTRFPEATTEIKHSGEQVSLVINFAFSAEKMIFQLLHGI